MQPTNTSQPATEPPFFKTAAVLWAGGTFGVVSILPYALSLQGEQLHQAVEQTGLPVPAVLAISVAQGAVLLALAVAAGLWASHRIGLGAPLIAAWLNGVPFPEGTRRALRHAALVGVLCAAAIIVLDPLVFLPLDPDGLGALEGANPPPWQGLLASFYGGIAEELYLRLFVLSLVALGLRALGRLAGAADRESLLPGWAFWGANLIAAVLFGLGHLPATAALLPITPIVVARAIALNGVAAIPFGWLFRRSGIEAAMVAHFAADIVLHVILPLV